jgi:hypothetical protein
MLEAGSSLEKEIWALEQAWYAHHRDGAPDKAYALLHDRFLGWPTVDSSVLDKDGMIALITEEDAGIGVWDFELQDPTGVRVIGDTAINHYKIRMAGTKLDGSAFTEILCVTHTWIHEASEWKLLSGMAYAVKES